MKKEIIDLEKFRTKNSKVFTGRERGIEVRKASNIDELIKNSDKIIVTVPSVVMSINPSFLEEFLNNIVLEIGKDEFLKKVEFDSSESRYDIEEDLYEAIDRILRNESALTSKTN